MGAKTHAEVFPKTGRRSARPSTAALAAQAPAQRRLSSAGPSSSPDPGASGDQASTLAAGARRSQRGRLLGAITHIAVRDGYEAVTIKQVIALAGVSRPTFYEYFTDKEDCFLQALAPIRRQLLADTSHAVASEPPEHATTALVTTLLAFAHSQPKVARLLMSDPLAGGSRLLDARGQLVAQAARTVEDAFQRAPTSAMIPDLPPRLLVGVICRLLANGLRRREPSLSEMLPELLGWLASYELPAARHLWRTLTPLAAARSPFLPPAALRAPPPLPSRPRMRADALAENQWLRIVFATAEIVARDGYAAATVAEITKLAGVDGRVFYRLFACKQRALTAARELLFRHLMAVTAGAFVAGEDWPERLWEAARALTQSVEQNATLSHASFVEGHAGGPAAIGRLQELVCAFTIFLQEGDRYQPRGSARPHASPSPLAQQAIVTAVFELCYLQARAHDGDGMSALLGHVAFISLAPFLGAAQTNDFLERKASPRSEVPPSAYEQQRALPARDSALAAAG